MLENYSTNATVAKIRSINGRMLTRNDLHEMVAKRSVAEVAEFLASTDRYADTLRDIDPNTIHRGLLERLLSEFSFNTYLRLTSFQGLEDKPFYDHLIKKNECRQLIALINAVNNGLCDSFVTSLPGYVLKHTRLDFLALAKCRSAEELIEGLKGTKYQKLLRSVPRDEQGRIRFTEAEVKLRTFYYKTLLESVRRSFSSSEADELEKLIKSEIDVINIINALRLKAFFDYSPDEIRAVMLPFTQLGKKSMGRLYESESAERMLALVKQSPRGRDIPDGNTGIETGLFKGELAAMRHSLAKTNSAPVALYAFMYISETELSNIIKIVEGVRYDVDPALIFDLLVV